MAIEGIKTRWEEWIKKKKSDFEIHFKDRGESGLEFLKSWFMYGENGNGGIVASVRSSALYLERRNLAITKEQENEIIDYIEEVVDAVIDEVKEEQS